VIKHRDSTGTGSSVRRSSPPPAIRPCSSGALLVVGLARAEVRLAYQVDVLRSSAHARDAIASWRSSAPALAAPLEQRARQLGLTVPARDQFRLARETSPAHGAGRAQKNRVEAALEERPTP